MKKIFFVLSILFVSAFALVSCGDVEPKEKSESTVSVDVSSNVDVFNLDDSTTYIYNLNSDGQLTFGGKGKNEFYYIEKLGNDKGEEPEEDKYQIVLWGQNQNVKVVYAGPTETSVVKGAGQYKVKHFKDSVYKDMIIGGDDLIYLDNNEETQQIVVKAFFTTKKQLKQSNIIKNTTNSICLSQAVISKRTGFKQSQFGFFANEKWYTRENSTYNSQGIIDISTIGEDEVIGFFTALHRNHSDNPELLIDFRITEPQEVSTSSSQIKGSSSVLYIPKDENITDNQVVKLTIKDKYMGYLDITNLISRDSEKGKNLETVAVPYKLEKNGDNTSTLFIDLGQAAKTTGVLLNVNFKAQINEEVGTAVIQNDVVTSSEYYTINISDGYGSVDENGYFYTKEFTIPTGGGVFAVKIVNNNDDQYAYGYEMNVERNECKCNYMMLSPWQTKNGGYSIKCSSGFDCNPRQDGGKTKDKNEYMQNGVFFIGTMFETRNTTPIKGTIKFFKK